MLLSPRWGQSLRGAHRTLRTKRGSDLKSMRSKKSLWSVRLQIANKPFHINNLIFMTRKASMCFRMNTIEDQAESPAALKSSRNKGYRLGRSSRGQG
jgi:hypothetical protein